MTLLEQLANDQYEPSQGVDERDCYGRSKFNEGIRHAINIVRTHQGLTELVRSGPASEARARLELAALTIGDLFAAELDAGWDEAQELEAAALEYRNAVRAQQTQREP